MRYSLIDVHAITLKKRLNRLLIIFKREKCLNAFLQVNMTNPIQLVAVATVLLCELH
jgi:hypothetical protein